MTFFNTDVHLNLNDIPSYELTLEEILYSPGVYQHEENDFDYIIVFPDIGDGKYTALFINEDRSVLEAIHEDGWDDVMFRKCDHIDVDIVLKRSK